jgi:hypothetical protein
METPPPVNINALSALLAKSKSVMQKVDQVKPITLSETTLKQTAIEAAQEPDTNTPLQPRAAGGYTKEQVLASKFPQAVKEAMIKSIPVEAPKTIRLEDMSDLEDIPMIPNKRIPISETRKVTPSNGKSDSDLITVSRGELKEMINESLVSFLSKSYNKSIREEAIKETINMLIREGKITVKKK